MPKFPRDDTPKKGKRKLTPEGKRKRDEAYHERTALRIIEGGAGMKHQKYRAPEDKPLTPKQEGFVAAMLKGSTAADAYRQAYNAQNMNDHSIRNEASMLLSHPGVSKALKEGFQRQREKAVHSAASLRLFVQERLYHEATEAKGDAARVRSLELLGKMSHVGLFEPDTGDEQDERSAEEIRQELTQRLQALIKDK